MSAAPPCPAEADTTPSSRRDRDTACFSIHARAEPGVMARVLELFAKRGLVPSRWHSAVDGPDGDDLTIDIHMRGMDEALARYVASCLRQIVGVEAVLASRMVRSPSLAD